jgi:glutaredoxin
MKKVILIAMALIVFQQWGNIRNFVNPPPDFSSVHDEQVILYATEWCGYCKKARELLAKHNISYYEYDIEKSSEGRVQYDRLGGKGVPMLLIDGEVIKGYNPLKILKLAKNHNN